MGSRIKINSYDVIDLTESFPLTSSGFCSNTVINLDTTDEFNNINSDSDDNDDQRHLKTASRSNSVRRRQKNGHGKNNITVEDLSKRSTYKDKNSPEPRGTKTRRSFFDLGECPICCEKIGKNPLASTICGHVFCLKCLEQCLKVAKKCPTCRRILKKSGYHPLYLNI